MTHFPPTCANKFGKEVVDRSSNPSAMRLDASAALLKPLGAPLDPSAAAIDSPPALSKLAWSW